jgi:outer membrane receptor protein involved in Fe transport
MPVSSNNHPGIVCASIVWVGIAAISTRPAMSAAAEDASPPSESALTEIIVTATRRAERLQDVPMSITALSGVELAKRGATNSAGLTSAEDLSLFNVPTGFRVRPRTVGLTLRASF